LIGEADVVLHDDLVADAVLALASPRAEIANVGKRCGAKSITQAQINARMIECARRNLQVVRLKSGDPGIFGRLAEEVDALEAAGVPFEVIPGITAGAAAAAGLGVSLTDRRASSRVIMVSGHRASNNTTREQPNWKDFARDDATLIIYMPGNNFVLLRAELLAANLDPAMPAVLVSHAASPRERRQSTTLGELHKLLRMESPAVLLIGRSLDRVLRRLNPTDAARAFAEAEILLSSL
jgi:uroporphyrin-III C-methyltransferase